MKNAVVFYHGNCLDGFGAAFSAWLVLRDNAQYVPCAYGDEPMDVTDKQVFILDFAFEPAVMARLMRESKALVLLDHHKTSRDKLAGLQCTCGLIKFDLTRSGAMLAWEYFHEHKPVPEMVQYIQDRDLWAWKLPLTKDYLAALDNLPLEFDAWKTVLDFTPQETQAFVLRGNAMNERFESLCQQIANQAAVMPVGLLGHEGLMVNTGPQFASDVGGKLALRSGTFGVIWHLVGPDQVKVSLRAVPSFDAEVLARAFGGGGHSQACSFSIPLADLPALIAGTLVPRLPK
jgi:hypothetical protein